MIYSRAGQTFEATTQGAPTGLEGTIGVRILDTPANTEVLARTTAGISEAVDGSGIYSVSLTTPDDVGAYSVIWDTGGGSPAFASEELIVNTTGAPAVSGAGFATADDVAARLGRELADNEQDQATLVIAIVTGLITDVVSEDAEWATDLDPVPTTYRALCIEKAVSALSNPESLAATTERLGHHEEGRTFSRSRDGGIVLTSAEERSIRKTYRQHRRSSVTLETPYSPSTIDDLPELPLS